MSFAGNAETVVLGPLDPFLETDDEVDRLDVARRRNAEEILDVDDAVEVLGADQPVVGAVAVVIQHGAGEMSHEDNGLLPVHPVVAADP